MKRAGLMVRLLVVAAMLTLTGCSNKKGGLFDTSGASGSGSSGSMSGGSGY